MHRDRPRMSEAYLRSALELNPRESRAHLALGLMALHPPGGATDHDAALNHFAAAKSVSTKEDPILDFLIASTKAQRGDPASLIRPGLTKLVNAKPQWDRVWGLLAWAWASVSDELDQKIAVYTGAHRFYPDRTDSA